jgi:hypothetical protein
MQRTGRAWPTTPLMNYLNNCRQLQWRRLEIRGRLDARSRRRKNSVRTNRWRWCRWWRRRWWSSSWWRWRLVIITTIHQPTDEKRFRFKNQAFRSASVIKFSNSPAACRVCVNFVPFERHKRFKVEANTFFYCVIEVGKTFHVIFWAEPFDWDWERENNDEQDCCN